MERNRFKCSMCCFTTYFRSRLVQHSVRTHRYDPHFTVHCASEGCRATYRNWASFKKHVQRKHQEADDEEYEQNNADDQPLIVHPLEDAAEDADRLIGVEHVQWHGAKFLLQIRDKYRTSHNAMLKIMEGSENLIQEYSSLLLSQIQNAADPNTGMININTVQRLFEEEFPPSSVFSLVSTKTNLDKFLESSLDMIVPEIVELGTGYVWRRRPRVRLVKTINHAYSIPFLKCLKRLLLNDQVRACVDNPERSRDVLKTILDGNHYQNHPIFSQHDNALAIVFYYDEIEVDNPLGSKSHKLGMFYWTLANIYPKYRSTLQANNLLVVARYCHINKHGIKKVLDQFVKDIKVLETQGISITVNGVEKNYKGSIVFVAADTPAAALVGGFKKSVTKTIKPCRRCLTDQDRWKLYFREQYFTLRDMTSHANYVTAVEDRTTTLETRLFWSRHYGVNERSVFMDLAAFDVTKCFPQDIMHILPEGVIEVEMRAFISYLTENNFISLKTLNERLMQFNYGHLQRDKPSPVLSDHLKNQLRQSAAQMICFSFVLPFLLGDLKHESVDIQNGALERLSCHTRLLQVTNLCYAFEIPRSQVSFLAFAIESFIRDFDKLYPGKIVPKFHFLVHIPNQILEFGPPRQQNCMRFEACHAWFKGLMRVIRNVKNLPWTFAYRHECLRCSELTSAPGARSTAFLYSGHSIKEGCPKMVVDLEFSNIVFEQLPLVNRDTCEVIVSPEVTVHGTSFKPGSIILVSCEEDDLPIFAIVKNNYVHNDTILLLYKPLENLGYFSNLNAYQVSSNLNATEGVMRVENLLLPSSLSIFTVKRLKYIVLFNYFRAEFIDKINVT